MTVVPGSCVISQFGILTRFSANGSDYSYKANITTNINSKVDNPHQLFPYFAAKVTLSPNQCQILHQDAINIHLSN